MSNRPLMLVAAGLISLCQRASAQVRSPEADSLLRRVMVLDSAMVVRSRSVDSVRRLIVRRLPAVDVRRGALHVRTDSSLARRVREAVDSVSVMLERRGSALFAARASAFVPTVTRDSTRDIFGILPVIAIHADTATRFSMIGQRQVPARPSINELANGLAAIVEQFAMQGADSAFSAWVMVGRAPLRPTSKAEAADAYIELATTESLALRRCRARVVAACLDALGLDSIPGSRLDRWYAPEDFRSLVRVAAPPQEDSAGVAAWIRCRHENDETACGIAARALENARVPLPLSASVRFGFLREVLDAGGDGAFDRLSAASGTMSERLAAAAREPLDRTVLRWLDRVEASRPDRMRLPATVIAASLGWSGLVLGLAIMRRTAWA